MNTMGARKNNSGRFLPKAKPKNIKETLKRLWMYIKGERKQLVLVFIFIIIDSIVVLFIPYLIGRSIDLISLDNIEFSLLSISVLALLMAYLGDVIINFIKGWLIVGISQRVVRNMRRALFEKLQKLPIEFFDTNSNGDIMSRLTNDIDNINTVISQSLVQLIAGIISIVGSLVMMLILSPILTLFTMITVPLVFLLTRSIARKTKVLFKNQQVELGKLNGYIEEVISGLEVVKAFNHEEKALEEFREVNSKLLNVGLKAQIWSSFLMPFMNVISNIGFATVSVVGGILAVKNLITVGVIASFINYSRQFTRPLNDLANVFNTLQAALAGSERVFEVLDEKEEKKDIVNARSIVNIRGEIEFKDVGFEYKYNEPILKKINFKVKPGSSIALVGPTGAGKTTIVNLITRFYDVSKGEILIDGIDIRNYKREDLRKIFGIVLQDAYLFSGTIKENIKYGNLNATDEEMKDAAKKANAHSFIKYLPKRYDTLLSESGQNLSQGQRQLLTIARAILAEPSILILDEATSSVDTRTEIKIQEAMLKVMKNRTSFIIAHRLSTIRDCDIIMVIDNGEILESGNHEDLIKKKGSYYNMYYKQIPLSYRNNIN